MATVETIFSELAKHMITGLMIHDQFESYYSFLNLSAYADFHKEQYSQESCDYIALKRYYMNAHDRLIKEMPIENPHTIPSGWINYKRMDVDVSTKRNAVRDGLDKWVKWEEDTKRKYEQAYKDLMELGEVADALFIKKLIKKVSNELTEAKTWYIKQRDYDFSIAAILDDQN